MYILILLISVSGKSNFTTSTVEFESSASCMRAISSALSLEDNNTTIKARCVAK